MDHSQTSTPRIKVLILQTRHRKSAETSQVSRYEIVQEIPISVLGQRERGWGARHSWVAKNGAGEPEMEQGSQKWSGGVRNGAGESEVDWGSQKWIERAKSGLHIIGIHLGDY